VIDEIDIANERIERDLEAAIAAQLARGQGESVSLDGICCDCGGAIEPARLAALHGCTVRCAACAQQFQHHLKPRWRL